MGWTFPYGADKKTLVKELCQNQETEKARYSVIDHSLRGNCLWIVRRVEPKDGTTPPVTFIELCLLSYSKSNGGYGYKDMDESMHPYFYSCPLKFLKMAPVANEEWRKGVIAYHERNKSPKVQPGKFYLLTNTQPQYRYVRIETVRPLTGYVNGETLLRIPRKCISQECNENGKVI